MTRRLIWSPRAQKDIASLHPTTAQRIRHALRRYAETGHADIRRLANITPPTWRIRIGHHRVILQLRNNPDEALIIRIKPRDSAYRAPPP